MMAPSETEFRCMTSLAFDPNQADSLHGFFNSECAVPWKNALNTAGARAAASGSVTASAPVLKNPHWPLKLRVALNGAAPSISVPTVVGGSPFVMKVTGVHEPFPRADFFKNCEIEL